MTARLALRLGLVFTLVIGAFVLIIDNEASPLHIRLRGPETNGMHPVPWPLAIPAAVALGMGLGTLVALWRLNRQRMRAVLRPNLGRVVSALVLALLLPVWQFWAIPFSAGFVVLNLAMKQFSGRMLDPLMWLALFGVILVVFPLCYIFASLIISGIARRWVRVALFAQVWIAAYAATLLIVGLYIGNL